MKLPALPIRRSKSATPATVKTAKNQTGVVRLGVGAVKDWLSSWGRFTWLVAMVAVPVRVLGLTSGTTSTSTTKAYGYFVILLMNVAVLWAVAVFDRKGRAPRAAEAYYDGSALIVRLLVMVVLFSLMLIPLMLGLFLYIAGANAGATAELIAILFVSLLIALPSLYMLVRYGLGFMVTAITGLRPLAAFRAANQLTRGKFWLLVRRYLGLVLLMLVLSIPGGLLNLVLKYFGQPGLASLLFSLYSTVILLPIFDLYLLRLYRSLNPKTEDQS